MSPIWVKGFEYFINVIKRGARVNAEFGGEGFKRLLVIRQIDGNQLNQSLVNLFGATLVGSGGIAVGERPRRVVIAVELGGATRDVFSEIAAALR